MRVIVCGGRDFSDRQLMTETLGAWLVSEIACGGARGADDLARDYAEQMGIPCSVYPANWSLYGKAAGPIRNADMLTDFRPDAVIAFPGGRGTADMVRRAKAAGVKIISATTPDAQGGGA